MVQQLCDVAVIGGGLAGACAAIAFAQSGCDVRLFERRDLARDPNRGDILQGPTIGVAERLGLLELLVERGAGRWRSLRVVDTLGEQISESQIQESWLLNHAEMEAAFLDAAESNGTTIQHEVVRSLTRAEPGSGWVMSTDRKSIGARFVVGADGAESLTRRTLGIELEDVHDYDNWIVVLHTQTPSWLASDAGCTLLHPDGTVRLLPTTPAGRHRVIISIPRGKAGDWMTSTEAELGRRLEARYAPLGELVLHKRGGSHVYRVKRTHAARYWGPAAALAGDAAHTIHPVGGQGLNIAIQDSAKLAELVGPLLRGPAMSEETLADALVEYEAIRRPINAVAIALSHSHSQMAGPGRDAYELALDFYTKAAGDPDFIRGYLAQFGGRQQ